MLELFQDTQSLYFVKSTTNPTEYILPPFYAGTNTVVRIHTLVPTFNPAAPYTEVAATNGIASLTTGNASYSINFSLAAAGGSNLYLNGNLNIPSGTNLISTNQSFADVFFGLQVVIGSNTIPQSTSATVKVPTIFP